MTDRTANVIAAFDVDGTLTVRDCVRPFLLQVGGYRGVVRAMARRPLATLIAAIRRDRDGFKEIIVGGVLRRRRVADVERIGTTFAETVRNAWLRSDTMARLRWHQQAGHRVVLVSASLGAYLRPLGRSIGVDGVLCTDAKIDGEVFVDRLDGGNCRAAEKVRRLDEWIRAERLTDVEIWAYGDSAGDAAMLRRADHAVWVNDTTVDAVPAEAA